MSKKMLIVLNLLILLANFAYAADKKEPATNSSLSLDNLGFDAKTTQGSTELQQTLQDRRYYLRQHQIFGIATLVGLAATLLSGGEGDLPPEHPFFAGLTVASYSVAAYMAFRAPEIPTESHQGGSAWHQRLMWVHLPGMILTPVLGYMAAKRFDDGKKLSGAEKYHKDVAGVTAVALAAAVISVSFEF